MTDSTRRKVAQMIPRLATDADGEALATVRALVRVLHSGGADLHALAALIEGDGEITGARVDGDDWRDLAAVALADGLARNEREREFLRGMTNWAGEPTEKQRRWLKDIASRAR